MTTFAGLFRKEWFLMRYWAIGFAGVNIGLALMGIAPIAVGAIVDIRLEMNELLNMWMIMHMYFVAALFLQSLHTDMKQPDVWLHSPASIRKLLGSKVVMAMILNVASLSVCLLMAGVASFMGGAKITLDLFGLSGGTKFFGTMLLTMIFMLSISLFVWVIYKLVAGVIGSFALLLILPLILAGSAVWAVLIAINETKGLFAGSLFYIILSILLFTSGAVLLEKKVRY